MLSFRVVVALLLATAATMAAAAETSEGLVDLVSAALEVDGECSPAGAGGEGCGIELKQLRAQQLRRKREDASSVANVSALATANDAENKSAVGSVSVNDVRTDANLYVGNLLSAGYSLFSANAELAMQTDGNLVVYTRTGRRPLWSPHKYGTGAWLTLQSDGNLVVYTNNGAIWATGTVGALSYRAVLQDDCNFVIYSRAGAAIWATGTDGCRQVNAANISEPPLKPSEPAAP